MRMAAVATIPSRDARPTLESLRPQVDRLAVYLNGYTEPAYTDLVDWWVCDPDNTLGSGGKLLWAAVWDDLYLACDDDLLYPPDYADVMEQAVDRWDRKALVTTHGRVLTNARFQDATWTARSLRATDGGWVNYPGTCGLAFHGSLRTPFPRSQDASGYGIEEAELAVWAQRERVPIWVIPHTADWLTYRLPKDAPTIFTREQKVDFAHRNAVLAEHEGPWKVWAGSAASDRKGSETRHVRVGRLACQPTFCQEYV